MAVYIKTWGKEKSLGMLVEKHQFQVSVLIGSHSVAQRKGQRTWIFDKHQRISLVPTIRAYEAADFSGRQVPPFWLPSLWPLLMSFWVKVSVGATIHHKAENDNYGTCPDLRLRTWICPLRHTHPTLGTKVGKGKENWDEAQDKTCEKTGWGFRIILEI